MSASTVVLYWWSPDAPFGRLCRSEDADLGEEVRYSRLSWSSPVFDKIMSQAIDRICLFLAKRHKGRRRYGWSMVRCPPTGWA